MLKPSKLFAILRHEIDFKKTGLDVDYAIVVYDSEKTIRLFFQGSQSAIDWIINFCFPVKPYKKAKYRLLYHYGWSKAYRSAKDKIMAELVQVSNSLPDYDVEIVGHSLGGALACYAAEDFNFRTTKKPTLITFGAPKPAFGSKTKERLLESCAKVYQFIHRNDFVPCLPPFYKHLDTLKLGKFKFKNIFKFAFYHTHYDDETYYDGVAIL